MADDGQSLEALDKAPLRKELDLVSNIFHRINRVIPIDQKVLTVPPTCKARVAIAMMHKHGYSQLPVVLNGTVLGVFSYHAFARDAAQPSLDDLQRDRYAPGDLPVCEYLEKLEFAHVSDEMTRVFDFVDRDSGILVGEEDELMYILTPTDFRRYLYQVASPFVALSEIELGIRALLSSALTREQIVEVATVCLQRRGADEAVVPVDLKEMTFEDYRSLISHGETWPMLERYFGGTRLRTSGKLKEIGELRNAVFHFKRDITVDDRNTLAVHREWLRSKLQLVTSLRTTEHVK